MHTLETRIKEVKITVAKGGIDFSDMSGSAGGVSLQYDTLIQLIEQLKTCVEVAESRTLNWQRFCVSDETVLPFLLQVWIGDVPSYLTISSQVSYLLDNGVRAWSTARPCCGPWPPGRRPGRTCTASTWCRSCWSTT